MSGRELLLYSKAFTSRHLDYQAIIINIINDVLYDYIEKLNGVLQNYQLRGLME